MKDCLFTQYAFGPWRQYRDNTLPSFPSTADINLLILFYCKLFSSRKWCKIFSANPNLGRTDIASAKPWYWPASSYGYGHDDSSKPQTAAYIIPTELHSFSSLWGAGLLTSPPIFHQFTKLLPFFESHTIYDRTSHQASTYISLHLYTHQKCPWIHPHIQPNILPYIECFLGSSLTYIEYFLASGLIYNLTLSNTSNTSSYPALRSSSRPHIYWKLLRIWPHVHHHLLTYIEYILDISSFTPSHHDVHLYILHHIRHIHPGASNTSSIAPSRKQELCFISIHFQRDNATAEIKSAIYMPTRKTLTNNNFHFSASGPKRLGNFVKNRLFRTLHAQLYS